jgi:hypothetical protein
MSQTAVPTSSVRALVPVRDRRLLPAECAELARAVAAAPQLWDAVELTPTQTGTRAYALLHEDEHVEVWLLAWQPSHTTGFHDHGDSNVGFCVVRGRLVEEQLRLLDPPTQRELEQGDSRSAGSDYIHSLEWRAGDPALSVHVYSPPLAVVGQYRVGAGGVLHRETQPGREELTRD